MCGPSALSIILVRSADSAEVKRHLLFDLDDEICWACGDHKLYNRRGFYASADDASPIRLMLQAFNPLDVEYVMFESHRLPVSYARSIQIGI